MKNNLRSLFALLLSVNVLSAAVNDITGDVGSAQTGSVTLSGGSSGAVFDSTTSTITQSFNYLALPVTSSTNGQILINGEPVLHGYSAGNQNTFVGSFAGNFTNTGAQNAVCGDSALSTLTSGSQNTALGQRSLILLEDGGGNTAVGASAGDNLVSGNGNILIGVSAGTGYTGSESNNIIIGSNDGAQGESNVTRIGAGQQECYVEGIYGVTVDFNTALPTYVDANNQLGTDVSSLRFKDKVKDIDNESSAILELRPVSFSNKKHCHMFGLIAEEVYKVFPKLVILDKEGKPFAVKYYQLPVLLLNEFKKTVKEIDDLQDKVKSLEKRLAKLEAQLK